jgi:hypothetical protein
MELFFWDTDFRTLVSVSVQTGGPLKVGNPKVYARGDFSRGSNSWYRNYDISPDGKTAVMMLRGKTAAGPKHFNVVLNWNEELRAREAEGR